MIIYHAQVLYKDTFWIGECLQWSRFLEDVTSAFDAEDAASRIEMVGLSDVHLSQPLSKSCVDPAAATEIIYNLVNPRTSIRRVNCDGSAWRVQRCANRIPVLCVDCEQPCDSAETAINPFTVGDCGAPVYFPKTTVIGVTKQSNTPIVRINSIEASSTSLELRVTTSVDGVLRCAAFEAGSVDVSALEIQIRAQNNLAFSEDGLAVMTISQLKPSTVYEAYCFSSSSINSKSLVSKAADSRTVVATSCCKDIAVDILSSAVHEGLGGSVDSLLVTVEHPPSEELVVTVSISVAGLGADGESRRLLSNSNVSSSLVEMVSEVLTFSMEFFGSVSVALPDVADFLPGPNATFAGGVISIHTNVSGSSASEYAVITSGGIADSAASNSSTGAIQVLSMSDMPPVPTVASAEFSRDGSNVVIKFDTNTDRAGVQTTSLFPCDEVLDFSGANLSSCQWLSDTRLSVRCDCDVGDVLRVKAGTIKSKCVGMLSCSAWNYTAAGESAVITAPPVGVTVVPTVLISGPSTISVEDDLTIDLSSSTGSGGRAWVDIGFNLTGSVEDVAAVEQFLVDNVDASGVLEVPASLLSVGTYTLTVKLCNFLGRCGYASYAVDVVESNIPIVTILGADFVSQRRDSVVTLFANTRMLNSSMVETGGKVPRSDFLYSWSIAERGITRATYSVATTNAAHGFFHIPSYSLETGKGYEVEVISSTSQGQLASRSVTVFIVGGDVHAEIVGGAVQTVTAGESVTLDGSRSYNTNLDPNFYRGLSANLRYHWICRRVLPSVTTTCGLDISGSTNRAKLRLRAAALDSVGSASLVTMTIVSGDRSAQASVMVTTVAPSTPQITIYGYPEGKFNAAEKLKLAASISSAPNASASWTVSEPSIALDQIALTSVFKDVASTGTTTFNLALNSGTLMPRSTLLFTLTCKFGSGQATKESLIVTTNGAPISGEFSISPQSGVALQDLFRFAASHWFDEDLPLTYAFSYEDSDGQQQALQERTPRTWLVTPLLSKAPSGVSTTACQVTVYDNFLAHESASFSVTLTAAPSLGSFLTSPDYLEGPALFRAIAPVSILTNVLNAVDCSAAPACAGLNRSACSGTANTCGPCLPESFVGLPGDGNTACFDPSTLPINSTSCVMDEECLPWEKCSTSSNNTCVIAPKACREDCSGRGNCLHVNSLTNELTDQCTWSDADCEAVCVCSSDWAGEVCEVPAESMAALQAVRAIATKSMEGLVYGGYADSVSLPVWLQALHSLTRKPAELTSEVAADLMALTWYLASESDAAALSYEASAPLLDSVDRLLEARRQSFPITIAPPESFYGSATESVGLFAELAQQDTVLGQAELVYVKQHFRAVLKEVELGFGIDLEQQVPSTPLERALGVQPTSVLSSPIISAADAASSGESIPLETALVLFRQQHIEDASTVLASPLLVDGTASEVLVEFHHFRETTYQSNDGLPEFYFNCIAGVAENHTASCGNGFNATARCDGVFDGSILTTCPYISIYPLCAEIYASSVIVENACSVADFSTLHTTCRCRDLQEGSWQGSTTGRRLLATDSSLSSGARQIAPIRKSQLIPTQNRFINAPTAVPTLIPTAVPTAVPTIDALYPIITFTIEFDIFLEDLNVAEVNPDFTLSGADKTGLETALMQVLNITDATANFITSAVDNSETIMLVRLRIPLTVREFCSVSEATDYLNSVLTSAMPPASNAFMGYVEAFVGDTSILINATAKSVDSTEFSAGNTVIVDTSATACRVPTVSPTLPVGVSSIDSLQGDGGTAADTNMRDSIVLYFLVIGMLGLISILYACYSNRRKPVLFRESNYIKRQREILMKSKKSRLLRTASRLQQLQRQAYQKGGGSPIRPTRKTKLYTLEMIDDILRDIQEPPSAPEEPGLGASHGPSPDRMHKTSSMGSTKPARQAEATSAPATSMATSTSTSTAISTTPSSATSGFSLIGDIIAMVRGTAGNCVTELGDLQPSDHDMGGDDGCLTRDDLREFLSFLQGADDVSVGSALDINPQDKASAAGGIAGDSYVTPEELAKVLACLQISDDAGLTGVGDIDEYYAGNSWLARSGGNAGGAQLQDLDSLWERREGNGESIDEFYPDALNDDFYHADNVEHVDSVSSLGHSSSTKMAGVGLDDADGFFTASLRAFSRFSPDPTDMNEPRVDHRGTFTLECNSQESDIAYEEPFKVEDIGQQLSWNESDGEIVFNDCETPRSGTDDEGGVNRSYSSVGRTPGSVGAEFSSPTAAPDGVAALVRRPSPPHLTHPSAGGAKHHLGTLFEI